MPASLLQRPRRHWIAREIYLRQTKQNEPPFSRISRNFGNSCAAVPLAFEVKRTYAAIAGPGLSPRRVKMAKHNARINTGMTNALPSGPIAPPLQNFDPSGVD